MYCHYTQLESILSHCGCSRVAIRSSKITTRTKNYAAMMLNDGGHDAALHDPPPLFLQSKWVDTSSAYMGQQLTRIMATAMIEA